MADQISTKADVCRHWDLNRPVPLYPLVFHAEGEEVTVGRADIDSYAIFPTDGAELVRRMADRLTPAEAAAWYTEAYGENVDIVDVLDTMAELGFVGDQKDFDPGGAGTGGARGAEGGRPRASGGPAPVRWQRLGRAAFSPIAWLCYVIFVGWCVLAMVRSPDLRPSYLNVFFSDYYTLVAVALLVSQPLCVLAHEAFHALAGRRLGLRTRLSVGRRLYFLVFETAMDGLVTVPRRRRYLPILAGMLADVLVMAVLTIVADLSRTADGELSGVGRFALALAYTALLRLAWQFYFYLRTDLYFLLSTALGCNDLHGAAKARLRNQVNRVLRRRPLDDWSWHPADRSAARWYSWLLVSGYGFSLGMLVFAVLPIGLVVIRQLVHRMTAGADGVRLADSLAFLGLTAAQLAFVGWLALRERRRAARIRATRIRATAAADHPS